MPGAGAKQGPRARSRRPLPQHVGRCQALNFERNIPTRPPKTYESIQTSTAQQVFDQFQHIICNRVRQRTTYRNEPHHTYFPFL